MSEPKRNPARSGKKRYKLKLTQPQTLVCAACLIVLLAGVFFAGWHFGVESTKFHGTILLVNDENRLGADYVPEALVNLYTQRHSFRLASSDIYLTRECYEAMEKMFHAAEEDDVNGFVVTSGYRDYNRQKEIFAESKEGLAQEPGASEHQTGLAFDVTAASGTEGFESTAQYAWLCENAYKYGFIQRYPANKSDITGISYEPWHYRYVGAKAAAQMRSSGETLEEFVANHS